MAVKMIVHNNHLYGTVISIAIKVTATKFKMAPDIYIVQHSKTNFFRTIGWTELKTKEHPIDY